MEQLKSMKDLLISQVHAQLANIEKADAKELGAAVDMIKDIAMTEYYCSIVKAMEEKEENGATSNNSTERYYYTERYMPIEYQRSMNRDMDRGYGRMYYDDMRYYGNGNNSSGNNSNGNSGNRGYQERENPNIMNGNDRRGYYEQAYNLPTRDSREGRSPTYRKSYMESKEMHMDKESQVHELEKYMQELSTDITDMIKDSSPEERQLLQKKLASLVTKIDQVK